MMKRIFLTALCLMLALTSVTAQRKHVQKPVATRHQDVELTVLASSNERFTVYIDGIPQSNSSGTRFTFNDITPNQVHDIAVVVERPIRFLLYTEMSFPTGKYEFEVYADRRDNYAEMYLTSERPTSHSNSRRHYGSYGTPVVSNTHVTSPTPSTSPTPPALPVPQYCSEADMSVIMASISQEPFDDTRLNYLKTVTISKQPFTTDQIRRIAQTFTFDNRRMEYVQFAFKYCYDPDNFFTLTDVFVHKSDKDKILKFIQNSNLR